MGIRFACHVCEKQLNIKQDLAGRRGICPACSSRFRIPFQDAEKSLPIEKTVADSQNVAMSAANSLESAGAQVRTHPGPAHADSLHSDPAKQDEASRNADLPASTESTPESTVKSTPATADRSVAGAVDLFGSEPSVTWYVRPPSGGQYGPASDELLKEWIKEGRVVSSSLLWRDGWAQWRDASDVLPSLSDQQPDIPNQTGDRPTGDRHAGDDSLAGPPSFATDANSEGVPKHQGSDASASEQGPRFSGKSNVGTARRNRSTRRLMLIGILAALAITLVCVLLFVANR